VGFEPCTSDEWLRAVSQLGLEVRAGPPAVELDARTASFDGLVRALLPQRDYHWLGDQAWWAAGTWSNARVIAGIPNATDPAALQGDDRRRTVVLARLHAPLLLGLRVVARLPLASVPRDVEGLVADRPAFRVAVNAPALAGGELTIRDSFVAIAFDGLTASALREALEAAVRVAGLLGGVLRTTSASPEVLESRWRPALRPTAPGSILGLANAWGTFARDRNLTFDALQWVVMGLYEAHDVTMDLRVAGDELVIDVGADLREGVSGRVDIALEAGRSWLARRLRPDARTGDAEFDARFFLRGDPSDAAVRALLAPPEVRMAIQRAFDWATSVSIEPRSVFAHSPLAPQTHEAIVRAFTDVVAIADALPKAVPVEPSGPYR
jgi:hypothetical protein